MQEFEKDIDGIMVISTKIPATRSIALKVKLLKIGGPSFIKLLDSIGVSKDDKLTLKEVVNKSLDSEINFTKLSEVFEDFAEKLDPSNFIDLILEILQCTRVKHDGSFVDVRRDVFDALFTDNLLSLYKIVFYALNVTYKDFFSAGGTGKIQM